MSKLIITTVAILTYISGHTQTLNQDQLDVLLPYFDNCRNKAILEEGLSREFYSEALQRIVTKNYTGQLKFHAVCRRDYNYGTLLFFQYIYSNSEIYRLVSLLVLSNDHYSYQELGNNNYNLDETANASETSMINDSIIQVIQLKFDFTFDKELDRDYQYFLVNAKGINPISETEYSADRNFKVSSERVLDEDYLRRLSQNELDIMRNEIYADHGYRFKSKKWKGYFQGMAWYVPRYDQVDDKLSIVEIINLQHILSVMNK